MINRYYPIILGSFLLFLDNIRGKGSNSREKVINLPHDFSTQSILGDEEALGI